MRKWFPSLLVFVLVLAFAIPARAQEQTMEERVKALEQSLTGWSIYGSIRLATFFEKSNSDFTGDTDAVTRFNPAAIPALTQPSQKITQWGLANNSRIGIGVDRKENFTGRVELGLRNDATVNLRLGYGTWTSGGVTFLFGQDYTPLSDWDYSTQVFNGDNNLKGWGIIDVDNGSRLPQVKIKAYGLQVALAYPKGAVGFSDTDLGAVTTNEVLLPTIMAKYRLNMDMFFADIFGGAGTFKVESDVRDKTVNSYAGGVGAGIKIDPLYVKGMVWMARNGKQLSLHQADAAGATFDAGDSYIEDDDLGWAAIVGAKVNGFGVEAGYGYVYSDQDFSGAVKNKAQSYYANVSIPVAQNAAKTESFFIVPEVGVFDYMKDSAGNDQGKVYYAGAKWQVNF